MTTMARVVTSGVDTHLDVHVFAALDELGVESFETTPRGYRRAWRWLNSLGEVELVGVEGTGSYGAGLTRFLPRRTSPSSRSTAPTGSAVESAASPIRKTPSQQPVQPSQTMPPVPPRRETAAWRPCAYSESLGLRPPRRATRQ